MEKRKLSIENLRITYDAGTSEILHGVSLEVSPGECVGIIGESGSGKSTLALAVMGLLKSDALATGRIVYDGQELLQLSGTAWDSLRWDRIALVFQNSLDVLNPVLTIQEQIGEALLRHGKCSRRTVADEVRYWLEQVGLESRWAETYPHQLSGGMRQKVLIAMALCCRPEVLLVDEPTIALDAVSKGEIVALLQRLQREQGFSMVVISHELPVIAALASRLVVLYSGAVLETGPTEQLLEDPFHPYTRGLVYSSPSVNFYRDIWGIPGEMTGQKPTGCVFAARCTQCCPGCTDGPPVLTSCGPQRSIACHRGGIVTMLEGRGLSKRYGKGDQAVSACTDCHLTLRAGEVCTLIGQSGSGKTTLAQMLVGLTTPDAGTVWFDGAPSDGHGLMGRRHGLQMVFQDPFSATNEQLTIGQIVAEPLEILRHCTAAERLELVCNALEQVQLPHDDAFLQRRGYTLSGGQRQRVAIARALVMEPRVLVADEISAMLDPSTAANILRLLKGLQNRVGFSMLYITHDLDLAKKISDVLYVMKDGHLVEHGPAQRVLSHSTHPYTRQLLHQWQALH